jgi:hypothetical protein
VVLWVTDGKIHIGSKYMSLNASEPEIYQDTVTTAVLTSKKKKKKKERKK